MFRSLMLGAACVGLGITAAQARSLRSAEEERPAAASESPLRPVSAIVSDGQPICTHTRRRLWLEGEGWVVRKIANCR